MKLGTYIKAARTRKHILQKDLAIKIQITPQYLNDLENDRREPSDATLQRLSAILGLNSDYAYMLVGKLPPDLRRTVTKGKMAKAYRIMRRNK